MYIKVTAAFQSDEQPDFEGMGLKATEDDFDNCIWDFLWIDYQSIITMNINDAGYTNVDLLNGQRWSVKESPSKVKELCNQERLDKSIGESHSFVSFSGKDSIYIVHVNGKKVYSSKDRRDAYLFLAQLNQNA